MSSEERISRSVSIPGVCDPARAGRRLGIAGVEQHRAALFHVGVEFVDRFLRWFRRAGDHRPVDQRKEREFVTRRIDADRFAGFQRRALRKKQRQP
jgi:hypothetical protein